MPLLPWQEYAITEACRVKDGNWASRTVCAVISRQNGKTTLIKMRILAGLFLWDEKLQIATAQNRDIALETFKSVAEMVDGFSWLRKKVKSVTRANGREEILLNNGCRYKVLAPTPSSSRGLSADCVYLDEARQHKTTDIYAAFAYTMQARPNPQMWLVSNAGDSHSVVLNGLRQRALNVIENKVEDNLTYLEWSAAPNRKLNDVEGWKEANPALGYTITKDVLEARMNDDPAIIQTEMLCQWVETMSSPWPLGSWSGCTLPNLTLTNDKPTYFGLEISPDRTAFALCGAQMLEDKTIGVGLMEYQESDTAIDDLQIADKVALWARKYEPLSIVANRFSGDSVVQKLTQAGIKAEIVGGAKYYQACDEVLGAMAGNRLAHSNQEILTTSVNACIRKTNETGSWYIMRRRQAAAAISMVLAVHKATELGNRAETDIAIG